MKIFYRNACHRRPERDTKVSVKNFEGNDVRFISEDGIKWVAAADIGNAIGFGNKKTSKIAFRIFKNKPETTKLIKGITTSRKDQGFGVYQVRCLNKGGINHFLNIARESVDGDKLHRFRDWLFDYIDANENCKKFPVVNIPKEQSILSGFEIEMDVFKNIMGAKDQNQRLACRLLIKRLKENYDMDFTEYLDVV